MKLKGTLLSVNTKYFADNLYLERGNRLKFSRSQNRRGKEWRVRVERGL